MKKILFYCQNLLGLGHLVRTTEIMRHLVKDFKVCLIEGGQTVPGLEIPPEVEVIHLPTLQVEVTASLMPIKTLKVADSSLTVAEVKELRKNTILKVLEEFQPDCLITEGYPFSKKHSLSFELAPLLEQVKSAKDPIKVVCSLRDIIMVKKFEDKAKEEVERCQFMNHYYDMLLYHSDQKIHKLEESFSKAKDLTCPVHYTGYVVQSLPETMATLEEDITSLSSKEPMILVSIGGGKMGHELIDAVVAAAPILEKSLPHRIEIFTGPMMPDEKFFQLQELAKDQTNLKIRRYTTQLIAYMRKASLSLSLGGYNTTMNVLKTGVRSMIYPSNKDREQAIRAEKLEQRGILDLIHPHELEPHCLAQKIVTCLNKQPPGDLIESLDLEGAQKTAQLLKSLLYAQINSDLMHLVAK
jgi:predicted glycosyltransferase